MSFVAVFANDADEFSGDDRVRKTTKNAVDSVKCVEKEITDVRRGGRRRIGKPGLVRMEGVIHQLWGRQRWT